jgi:hypothetical protein
VASLHAQSAHARISRPFSHAGHILGAFGLHVDTPVAINVPYRLNGVRDFRHVDRRELCGRNLSRLPRSSGDCLPDWRREDVARTEDASLLHQTVIIHFDRPT